MKFRSNILLFSTAALLSACQMQDSAEIFYDLDDYIGESTATNTASAAAPSVSEMVSPAVPEQMVASDDLTMPVTTTYQAPESIAEEKIESLQAPQSDVAIAVDTKEDHSIPAPAEEKEQVIKISAATHTVGKGDTLYSLSRQYDIPIMPIIIANNLQVPFDLKTGQVIKIPEGSFHVVKGADTLYSISRQYGVDMSALTKINGLSEPFSISKGQKLQIPFPTYHSEDSAVVTPTSSSGPQEVKLAESAEEAEQLAAEAPSQPAPTGENTTVATTETTSQGGPASLQKAHQNLFTFKNDKAVYDKNLAAKPTTTTAAASTEPAEKMKTAAIIPVKVAKEDSRGISKTGFMWPLEGKVVKKFGSQVGNEYSDGINIAASAGTEVKASSSGRVVYTGDSLKSYGNLVIVKHDNGLLSAYAHLDKINVSKDQKISRGQILGTVGSSGKVNSPQLYFAIRKGKDARDPNIYLP